MSVTLYSYYRSSASYRVRIALNIKAVDYCTQPVHLLRQGGEQMSAAFLQINPQGLVPVIEIDGRVLTQSVAIIEYLEETRPHPALLPVDAGARAEVRSMVQLIASDLHPLNNLRVQKFLTAQGFSAQQSAEWIRHWVVQGFNALEQRLERCQTDRRYCFGSGPGVADLHLVPQVYNARRFEIELDEFPRICAINDHCLGLEAFARAVPEAQPDFPG